MKKTSFKIEDMHCANCTHWLWHDGLCDCNNRIAKGGFDKICPNCENTTGEGKCISAIEEINTDKIWEHTFT